MTTKTRKLIEGILTKIPLKDLKAVYESGQVYDVIEETIEKRNKLKNFKADALIRVADLLEGKGPYKNKGVKPENFDMAVFARSASPGDEYIQVNANSEAAKALGKTYVPVKECGFAACACGHAGLDKWFRQRGFMIELSNIYGTYYQDLTYKGHAGFDAAQEFFGLTVQEAEHLFMDRRTKAQNTRGAVASRIREFVKAKKAEQKKVASVL